jgi:hypothetical protein
MKISNYAQEIGKAICQALYEIEQKYDTVLGAVINIQSDMEDIDGSHYLYSEDGLYLCNEQSNKIMKQIGLVGRGPAILR